MHEPENPFGTERFCKLGLIISTIIFAIMFIIALLAGVLMK
ncbi:MAG: hypothetical protein WC998_04920 [Candidatus Paceibacterota bacterium]|jgi:hypothetical protein